MPLAAALILGIAIAACTGDSEVALEDDGAISPSTTFTTDTTPTAEPGELPDATTAPDPDIGLPVVFSDPTNGLTEAQLADFIAGQTLFDVEWTPLGTGAPETDGLGPLFNAESCAACHPSTGRRRVPPQGELTSPGLVFRMSIGQDTQTGEAIPEPIYGDQLQDRAVGGVEPEASAFTNYITQSNFYADGTQYDILWPTVNIRNRNHGPLTPGLLTSARIGSQLIGMGLLELIPEEDILALSDPTDADGDGISGRPNPVWNPQTEQIELGRFGWKANVVGLDQQIAFAAHGDIGLTSNLVPGLNCAPEQTICLDASAGENLAEPEVSDEQLAQLTEYMRTLAVPEPRTAESEDALRGQEHFRDFGCASCHIESFTTGVSEIDALSEVTIAPYTDLLLHDLGFDMADNRPDFGANGIEWRTQPLWGLGLVPVDGDRGLLHDGRARNIEEAILWHGGEGRRSRDAFINAELAQREELLAFLESL